MTVPTTSDIKINAEKFHANCNALKKMPESLANKATKHVPQNEPTGSFLNSHAVTRLIVQIMLKYPNV